MDGRPRWAGILGWKGGSADGEGVHTFDHFDK